MEQVGSKHIRVVVGKIVALVALYLLHLMSNSYFLSFILTFQNQYGWL